MFDIHDLDGYAYTCACEAVADAINSCFGVSVDPLDVVSIEEFCVATGILFDRNGNFA